MFLDSLMVPMAAYLSIEFFDRMRNKIKVDYEYVENFANSKEYYDKFRNGTANKGRARGMKRPKLNNIGEVLPH